MTVKVGDNVMIVKDKDDLTVGNGYTVVEVDYGEPCVIDDVGDRHFLIPEFYTTLPEPLSTKIRARMEEHMTKGEYVRAVKWAQIAEQVEALEDE